MAKKKQIDDRTLSELRNLGPACEQDLNAAGIFTAADLIALGPKEAFVQLLIGRVKQGRSTKCCNASYLYALYGAIHDRDWRALSEEKKSDFKAFTAKLRESGHFG